MLLTGLIYLNFFSQIVSPWFRPINFIRNLFRCIYCLIISICKRRIIKCFKLLITTRSYFFHQNEFTGVFSRCYIVFSCQSPFQLCTTIRTVRGFKRVNMTILWYCKRFCPPYCSIFTHTIFKVNRLVLYIFCNCISFFKTSALG